MEPIGQNFKKIEFQKKETFFMILLFSFFVEASFGYYFRAHYSFALCFILLLSLKFFRPAYVILTLLLTIISALYFPVGRIFGNPNYNSFISAIYTNPQESKDFLTNIPIIYYIGSVLLATLGVFISRLRLKCAFKTGQIIFMATFVIAMVFYEPTKQLINGNKFYLTEITFTPIRFLQEAYAVSQTIRDDHKKIKYSLNKKDTWEIISSTPKYKTYILVIGESVRKDFMQLYGFPIHNTPFAEKSNGLFFENYISAGPSTILSLTNSLSKNKTKLQNNIITMAKKAGFYTYWISNQDYLGIYDTPVSIIGKHADSTLFIKTFNPIKYKNAKDEELLPFINKAIYDKTITQPKLIIIHLIGSHPPVHKRTDDKFNIFFHSKNASCYIQSIYNTDKLLEQITVSARTAENSWSMLYFSDHGLALENGVFIHSDRFQENYRVPMFIISSDDTRRENISSYRSALNFPEIFSQWTSIQESSIKSEKNYLSDIPYEDQNSVILVNQKKVNVNTLPLNPVKD